MFWHKCIMHASVMLATFHWQISPVLSWRISVFPPLPHSPTPKQFGKRNRFFLRCRITTQSAECRLVVLMCQGVVFFTASTALWKSWYLSMEIFVCFCKQMKMCSLDPHIIQYNHRLETLIQWNNGRIRNMTSHTEYGYNNASCYLLSTTKQVLSTMS